MVLSPDSAAAKLRVAGLVPLSTVDWPEKLAAVVFCQGCPWRCRYCHNQEILSMRSPGKIAFSEVLSFLEKRRGLLDGVVFSGGEALAQPAVIPAIESIKAQGFQIGLHNAGAFPKRLEQLLAADLLDWVGQDVKALPRSYAEVTGVNIGGEKAWTSVKMLLDAGVDFEARLTVYPGFPDNPLEIARRLKQLGTRKFALQVARGMNAEASSELARIGLTESGVGGSWPAGSGVDWKQQVQAWAKQLEGYGFEKFYFRNT